VVQKRDLFCDRDHRKVLSGRKIDTEDPVATGIDLKQVSGRIIILLTCQSSFIFFQWYPFPINPFHYRPPAIVKEILHHIRMHRYLPYLKLYPRMVRDAREKLS